MADPCKYGFMVIYTPYNLTERWATVDKMRVVGAWASTSPSMARAREHMNAHMGEYVDHVREFYGLDANAAVNGKLSVVATDRKFLFI